MRKAMYLGCAMLVVLATTLFASPAKAIGIVLPVPPPQDRIVIDVVTVNGSGCPVGTAAVAMSPDNEAFTVTYSNYIAQVGVGATTTDFRKNCQLNLVVHVPQGFTYAISKVDYRGFASIENGASAVQRANYYFQGSSQTAYTSHPFAGPLADDWQTSDEVPIAAMVWHPCGALRNLNINTELRVSAGTSDPKKTTSFISMDSTDGAINTVYHFQWATCPSS
ncbi:DUF4360 domain-containing protein [Paractinoplanes rishiriensis]|uniref:DUF4360 domain-containing protein n=1 Tax=Paractinoplanes rishiriensis TaxID=1050105 RepID=A0A919MXE1_9ACTN|nr:DUF4360 domain-containing protein [Actinoplanes rishiriensis]GIE95615.1 hypothetical protein Ari01nite_30800 [Actinoplanes rishiriensis]